MAAKEPGAASTPPAGAPAAQPEPQSAQKVVANKPKEPEKKSRKERWAEAKAEREATKKDGKKDGHILKNFAVSVVTGSHSSNMSSASSRSVTGWTSRCKDSACLRQLDPALPCR
jgi:hypothetical protein